MRTVPFFKSVISLLFILISFISGADLSRDRHFVKGFLFFQELGVNYSQVILDLKYDRSTFSETPQDNSSYEFGKATGIESRTALSLDSRYYGALELSLAKMNKQVVSKGSTTILNEYNKTRLFLKPYFGYRLFNFYPGISYYSVIGKNPPSFAEQVQLKDLWFENRPLFHIAYNLIFPNRKEYHYFLPESLYLALTYNPSFEKYDNFSLDLKLRIKMVYNMTLCGTYRKFLTLDIPSKKTISNHDLLFFDFIYQFTPRIGAHLIFERRVFGDYESPGTTVRFLLSYNKRFTR